MAIRSKILRRHTQLLQLTGSILVILFFISCRSTNTVQQSELAEQTGPSPEEQARLDSIQQAEEEAQRLLDALTDLYKDEIYSNYQAQANTLTNYYILAQQNFFAGDYENALFLINRAALIKESADVLALRGSIYLGLGYINEFVNHWRRALEMDPEVPIPQSPYIIQQLQNNGLIDERLRKAF